MPNYGDAQYWDDRYTKQPGTTFDWLEGWSELKEVTLKYCLNGFNNASKVEQQNQETNENTEKPELEDPIK